MNNLPLSLLDTTATAATWEFWQEAISVSLNQFRPIPGRGLRIRIEIVDTQELEASQSNDN